MHICIVCNEYPPCKHGGIGSFTKDLAEGLVSVGHKVSVVGIYNERELKIDKAYSENIHGVEVYRYPLKQLFKYHRLDLFYNRIRLFSKLKKLHEEERIDVLEAPDFDGWLPFGTPKKIPFVSRLHGGVTFYSKILERKVSPITRFLEKSQLTKNDHIVSVSQHTAETTRMILELSKEYQVIYNSIKMPSELPKVDMEKGLVLFYGSVIPKKGITELVLAFDQVARELDDIRLVIAGKNNYLKDGIPYEEYLMSLISEKTKQRIQFTGPLDRESELFPLVMSASLCCFPSHAEAFALAPLEAMAMGKAVLFTQYTSGPEAIEDGISGVLADTKDYRSIAQKIKTVLADPVLAEQLGAKAQQRIQEKFSYDSWIHENKEMFEALQRKTVDV